MNCILSDITVQNKMHFALHGNTAANLIYHHVYGGKSFAWLTSWTGNKPVAEDTLIAKNYLTKDEINTLNRIVMLYLEFAEMQAENHVPMYMSPDQAFLQGTFYKKSTLGRCQNHVDAHINGGYLEATVCTVDWVEKLDSFLKLCGKALLSHTGKISHELAEEKG
jgi:hypothetical protein